MKHTHSLARIFGWILFVCLAASLHAQSGPAGVAQRRLAHLQHGINASEWFAQVYDPKGYTKEHFENWMTARDIALIKSMGFDNVRLSVNPQPMFRHGHADEIPADYLGYLDAAVKMILDQGLAVTIDIHPDSDFKAKLGSEDDFVEQFCEYWRALARHYSTFNPDLVFFEIMNEPELRDRYRWYGIQAKSQPRFAKAPRNIPSSPPAPGIRRTTNCCSSKRCTMRTSFITSIFTIPAFLLTRAPPGP